MNKWFIYRVSDEYIASKEFSTFNKARTAKIKLEIILGEGIYAIGMSLYDGDEKIETQLNVKS